MQIYKNLNFGKFDVMKVSRILKVAVLEMVTMNHKTFLVRKKQWKIYFIFSIIIKCLTIQTSEVKTKVDTYIKVKHSSATDLFMF